MKEGWLVVLAFHSMTFDSGSYPLPFSIARAVVLKLGYTVHFLYEYQNLYSIIMLLTESEAWHKPSNQDRQSIF